MVITDKELLSIMITEKTCNKSLRQLECSNCLLWIECMHHNPRMFHTPNSEKLLDYTKKLFTELYGAEELMELLL